jgi:hypothetical protein
MEKVPVYHIIDKKAERDRDNQATIYKRGRGKFLKAMREINETEKFRPKKRRKIQEEFIAMIDDHFDWYNTRNRPPDEQRGKQFDLEVMHFIKLELKGILDGEASKIFTPTTRSKGQKGKERQ